jgi:hypothetical protein
MNGPDCAAGPTLRNRGQLETIPEDREFIPWWVGLTKEEIQCRLVETERNSKKVVEFLRRREQQEDICPCCIVS